MQTETGAGQTETSTSHEEVSIEGWPRAMPQVNFVYLYMYIINDLLNE